MTRMLLAVILGSTLLGAAWAAEPGTVVWCGLDYSMVKMIGSEDFRKPEDIFPDKLVSWNALFMKEDFSKLEKKLSHPVIADTKAVQAANAKVTAACILHEDGSKDEMVKQSHITEDMIARTVKAYQLKSNEGLGLVFIVDRLVKKQKVGCIYVTFFDLASRRVVLSQRVEKSAGGVGFRNYWFHPVKETVDKLPDLYKEATRAL